jgi:hypothetical protein
VAAVSGETGDGSEESGGSGWFGEIAECMGLSFPADGTPFEFEAGEVPFPTDAGTFDELFSEMFADGFDEAFDEMFADGFDEAFDEMFAELSDEGFEGFFDDFEFSDESLGEFELDGTHVSVFGSDGLTVVEFGDGDGSVTITQEDGETSITVDGSAELQMVEFPDLASLGLDSFDHGLLDDFESCLTDPGG